MSGPQSAEPTSTAPSTWTLAKTPERAFLGAARLESGPRVVPAREIREGKEYRPLEPVLSGIRYTRVTDAEITELVHRLSRLGQGITTEELTTLRHARQAQAERAVLVRRLLAYPSRTGGGTWREDLGFVGLPLDYPLIETEQGRAEQ